MAHDDEHFSVAQDWCDVNADVADGSLVCGQGVQTSSQQSPNPSPVHDILLCHPRVSTLVSYGGVKDL